MSKGERLRRAERCAIARKVKAEKRAKQRERGNRIRRVALKYNQHPLVRVQRRQVRRTLDYGKLSAVFGKPSGTSASGGAGGSPPPLKRQRLRRAASDGSAHSNRGVGLSICFVHQAPVPKSGFTSFRSLEEPCDELLSREMIAADLNRQEEELLKRKKQFFRVSTAQTRARVLQYKNLLLAVYNSLLPYDLCADGVLTKYRTLGPWTTTGAQSKKGLHLSKKIYDFLGSRHVEESSDLLELLRRRQLFSFVRETISEHDPGWPSAADDAKFEAANDSLLRRYEDERPKDIPALTRLVDVLRDTGFHCIFFGVDYDRPPHKDFSNLGYAFNIYFLAFRDDETGLLSHKCACGECRVDPGQRIEGGELLLDLGGGKVLVVPVSEGEAFIAEFANLKHATRRPLQRNTGSSCQLHRVLVTMFRKKISKQAHAAAAKGKEE